MSLRNDNENAELNNIFKSHLAFFFDLSCLLVMKIDALSNANCLVSGGTLWYILDVKKCQKS